MRTSSIAIVLSLFFFLVLLHIGVFDNDSAKEQMQHQGDNVTESASAAKRHLSRNTIIGLGIILFGVFLSYKLIANPCNENYNEPATTYGGDTDTAGPVIGSSCRFGGLGKEDSAEKKQLN